MNSSTKLSLLLASSIIGMHAFAQESTTVSAGAQRVAPLAAATLMSTIRDVEEIKNVILTAYSSLPPAEQQQIMATLLNIFVSTLQNTQTTTTTQATQTTSSTPTTNTNNQTVTSSH